MLDAHNARTYHQCVYDSEHEVTRWASEGSWVTNRSQLNVCVYYINTLKSTSYGYRNELHYFLYPQPSYRHMLSVVLSSRLADLRILCKILRFRRYCVTPQVLEGLPREETMVFPGEAREDYLSYEATPAILRTALRSRGEVFREQLRHLPHSRRNKQLE